MGSGFAIHSPSWNPVSILLLMEIPKWVAGTWSARASMYLFQSFFWWKSRNGKNVFEFWHWIGFVSILLLMEIPKWVDVVFRVFPFFIPFQSFFWWKSRNGRCIWPQELLFELCFNPSFDGNPEMGTHNRQIGFQCDRFQSFFWWKSRNGHQIAAHSEFLELVSILLLMEIPKWANLSDFNTCKDLCFNPSFDGNPEMGAKYDDAKCGGFVFQSFFWWKSRNGKLSPIIIPLS